MENLYVEGTDKSPYVDFKTDGTMVLKGIGRIENTIEFFNPLFDWTSNAEVATMKFDVDLEYYNTAFSKCLLEIFKLLRKNENIKNVEVNWMYEEEDEDSYESGEMMKELFSGFNFNFITK